MSVINVEAEWLVTVFYNKVMAIACLLAFFFLAVRIKIENIYIVPCFVSDTVLNLFKHYFS